MSLTTVARGIGMLPSVQLKQSLKGRSMDKSNIFFTQSNDKKVSRRFCPANVAPPTLEAADCKNQEILECMCVQVYLLALSRLQSVMSICVTFIRICSNCCLSSAFSFNLLIVTSTKFFQAAEWIVCLSLQVHMYEQLSKRDRGQ